MRASHRRLVIASVVGLVVVLAGGIAAYAASDSSTGAKKVDGISSAGQEVTVTTLPPPPTVPPGTVVTEDQLRAAFDGSLRCMADAGLVVSNSNLTIVGANPQVGIAFDLVASKMTADEASAIDSRCRTELITLSNQFHQAGGAPK